MSDASNVEVTLTVQNNSEVEMGDVVDGYAADQAREYQEKAGEYAADASTARIWRKPGRRVTVLLQGKVPVHLKFGQIQPDNGQKASQNRTEFPEQGPPKPGLKQPGPGPKVMQHRMEFQGPSLPRPGQRFLPKKRPKHPPMPRQRIPVPKLLPAVRLQPRCLRKEPPPRLLWHGKVPKVLGRSWPRCRLT